MMAAHAINAGGAEGLPLWRGSDVAAATGGAGASDWLAFGVAIDSRAVAPGDLFVALAGPRHDGHDFVPQAFAAGAHAAIVDAAKPLDEGAGPLLRVADCQAALVALGQAARRRSQARIVAVTGSAGKTGVKDALYRCLGRQALAHASVKSFNNEIGVPLTLARMPADAHYGVFEIGMNHAGEIARLAPMVRPHVAIITTVASAHREFFDSEEAIADAKAEIFTGLPPDGIAVLNRDNRHFERLAAQARNAGVGHILTFGIDGAADVRAQDIVLHETLSCVAADVAGTRLFFKVGIPGRHWVMNALGALAVVHALDGDLSLAALALAELRPLAGRGARARIATKRGHATVIDESYNANPESMRAALAVLGAAQTRGSGRRIAVLGDMMELGADATRAHGDLASAVIAAKADLVIATGPLMRALAERLIAAGMRCLMAADADGAYEALMPRLRDGDVILVKGSNASGMQRLVDRLKLPPRARPRSDD